MKWDLGEWQSAFTYGASAQRYDQSTFLGRLATRLDELDPRLALPEFFLDMSVASAREALRAFENGSGRYSSPDLWMAKNIIDSHVRFSRLRCGKRTRRIASREFRSIRERERKYLRCCKSLRAF